MSAADEDFDPDLDEEEDHVTCPACNGSGLEWEGWPCE